MSTQKLLSLCMIVKPDPAEAKLLDRCLASVAPHVDEICLTITGENKDCEEVASKYGAKVSRYVWDKHFANARNFNFTQATGKWILWLDCDDIAVGADKLEGIVKSATEGVGGIIADYWYDFNEYGDCIVKHSKTRIVRNDGSLRWEGQLHEDFTEVRKTTQLYTNAFHVEHYPDKKHIDQSSERNLDIAKEGIVNAPDDPRSWWNYANSLMMNCKWQEAVEAFFAFILKSKSEEEKFIAWDRTAYAYKMMDKLDHAIDAQLSALRIRPWYPDAWIGLGEMYYLQQKIEHAKFFLLEGMKLKPPVHEIIAYNPRLYDFIPLQLLAKVYYQNKEPKEALMCIETALRNFPKHKELLRIKDELEKEVNDLEGISAYLDRAKTMTSRTEIKKLLDNLPDEWKHHPMACHLRNVHFVKTQTTGKEVVIYCSDTAQPWSPESEKTGIGGSEEAVINLSRRWAEAGYQVTVYATIGHKEFVHEGVTWRPFWSWNYRDKHDILILWRTPAFCDFDINAKAIFVDLHDVIDEAEFTQKRLKKIEHIFVKSKAHRDLFPNIPDNKFVIVGNGINPGMFDKKVKKKRNMIINTSSPDRGLLCLLDLMPRIRARVPDAELHWFYGWNTFDAAYAQDEERQEWKRMVCEKIASTEGVIDHGRIGHEEIAAEYKKAKVFAYPTEFYEIFCISAVKAQAAGAIPVVTNVAALQETVQFGTKINAQDIYTNKDAQNQFVDAVVSALESDEDTAEMERWGKGGWDWDIIAGDWTQYFSLYL